MSLALLAVSCQKDEFVSDIPSDGDIITLDATFEGHAATRATESEMTFAWEKDDKILVFTTGEPTAFIASSAGASTKFQGSLAGASFNKYAVYPLNMNHKLEGEELTVNLPETYTHSATVMSPMIASLNAKSTSMSFKHVGSVLKFTLNNVPQGAEKLVFETSVGITGDFVVNADDEIDVAEKAEGNNSVTVKFAALAEETDDMVFYIPVPTGALPGLDLAIYDAKGERVAYSSILKTVTLGRADMGTKTIDFTSVDGSISKDVKVPEEATDATETLAGAVESGAVDPKVDMETPSSVTNVTLPASFTSADTENSQLNVNYTDAPSSITVKENDGASPISGDSKGEVNVLIPTADAAEVQTVNIDTPNLTASVQAKGTETLTIQTMTAKTANNTLVIGKNVVVKNLTVNGGNVIVEMGGAVERLTVADGVGTIYVYDENAAQLEAGIGYVVVKSAEELALRSVLANGGEYTLNADMEISSPLVLDKDVNVVLNLDGHKVINKTVYTASETDYKGDADVFYVSDGTLTINGNGTVEAQAPTINDYSMAVFADADGHVIINGGTYVNSTADSSEGQLDLIYARKNAVVDIYGGTFESKSSDKWVVNKKDASAARINVYGGIFKGYNPSASDTENPIANFVKKGIVAETAAGVFEVLPEVDGVVTLAKDLAIHSPIFTYNDLTIDLGTHEISDAGVEYIKDVQAALIEVYGGNLTVRGSGSVKSTAERDNYAVCVRNGSTVNIEGGVYEGSTTAVNVIEGTANIKGGEYSQVGYASDNYVVNCLDANYKEGRAKVNISGGVFHKFNPQNTKNELTDPTSYVSSGLVAETAAGVFEVLPEVDGVVTLATDLEIHSQINILKNMILDLGAYSILPADGVNIWNTDKKTWSLVSVQGGDVTIKGSGSIAASNEDSYALDVRNGAKLSIEGGTHIGNISAVYIFEGNLSISGGIFKIQQLSTYKDYRYLINCYDSSNSNQTATVSVTGGSFYNYDPSNSNSENPIANFVAADCSVTSEVIGSDTVYTVSKN